MLLDHRRQWGVQQGSECTRSHKKQVKRPFPLHQLNRGQAGGLSEEAQILEPCTSAAWRTQAGQLYLVHVLKVAFGERQALYECEHIAPTVAVVKQIWNNDGGEMREAPRAGKPCSRHLQLSMPSPGSWQPVPAGRRVNKHGLEHIWNSALNFSALKLLFFFFSLDYLPTVFSNSWLIFAWLFNTLFG